MLEMYALGIMIGKFVGGLIPGLFPLVVGIAKKRTKQGVIWMLTAGFAGYINPIISILIAVIAGIVIMRQEY